jgi:DNA repair photolyase
MENRLSPLQEIVKWQNETRELFYQLLDGKIRKEDFNAYLGKWTWADRSYNIQASKVVCPHQCKYCYAQKMAVRFGRERVILPTTFTDRDKVEKNWKGRKSYVYMFPSAHDIFPENVDDYLTVAIKMISAGHNVVCVSKPHLFCIQRICDILSLLPKDYDIKKNFIFRFTIGSCNDEILKDWEPGAPLFKERWEALQYAYYQGFSTSVSMEPMIDDPDETIRKISPWAETIWLGPMNYMTKEMDVEDAHLSLARELWKMIPELIRRYRENPKIYWKDAIIKYMLKRG